MFWEDDFVLNVREIAQIECRSFGFFYLHAFAYKYSILIYILCVFLKFLVKYTLLDVDVWAS